VAGQRGWLRLRASVRWEEDDGQRPLRAVRAGADFQTQYNGLFELLRPKFEPELTRVVAAYREFHIYKAVSPDNPGACMPMVDEAMRKWIDLWGQSGGL